MAQCFVGEWVGVGKGGTHTLLETEGKTGGKEALVGDVRDRGPGAWETLKLPVRPCLKWSGDG